jgi:hypothetical protein
MIQRIRNSRTVRIVSVFLIMNILAEILSPMQAMALTGGPAQPEFGSFTPIGASDMVDLSSGDMNYNIPLMDVGGYPLNIAYSSGIGMDDEASWVGLGWNLSVGQINRNVRGLPDDFQGDELVYENKMKPNITVGANVKFTPGTFGKDGRTLESFEQNTPFSYSLAASYNNYSGYELKPSVGMQLELSKKVSVGFNVESGSDGLSVSPSVSIHAKSNSQKTKNDLTGTLGVSMNSRQGMTSASLSMSKKTQAKALKHNGKTYGNNKDEGGPSVGSSIGFAENSYTPTKRVGMTTGTFTFNAAYGTEIVGFEGQAQVTAYGTVQVVTEPVKRVKAYGYENTDKAGKYGVVDFNREKESSFSVNSTNLPVTNYTYDIYSVQGQGVSGMYRPYRNQVGYVFDSKVEDGSTSGSLGLEFGVGNAAHLGVDIEATEVSSASGVWEADNYMLTHLKETYGYNPRYEKVHFKQVGDLSSDVEMDNVATSMFNRTGRYQATRVSYVGNRFHRRAVNDFKYKTDSEGHEALIDVDSQVKRSKRQARNQSIYNLTVGEIKSGIGYGPIARNDAEYATSGTSSPYVRTSTLPAYHTGEVQVVRNDGARYIYGLPAYNRIKREATFSVSPGTGNCANGLVSYNVGDNSLSNIIGEQYFNRVTTPAYVHTYLLTSVLSTDYQDRSNDGPTVDDLGSYTKFSYALKNRGYRWRVPCGERTASFNEGLKTDGDDDQGNYVYGEKEQYYIKKIETKTHIAIFKLSDVARKDGYGVQDEDGKIDATMLSYKLESISLYSRPEYEANPTGATPIKVANFEYDYSLCGNVPNNIGGTEFVNGTDLNLNRGKLTLKRIYFTYRKSKMGKYTPYDFNYANANPDYNLKGYDTWGNYKPNNATTCGNNATVGAAEYAFTEQNKSLQDQYAAAWTMSSIDLPSGGRIALQYESDDYAYVQDKHALRMYTIAGSGNDGALPTTEAEIDALSNQLYENLTLARKPNKYLYIRLGEGTDVEDITPENVAEKLIGGIGKNIHFRFLTNMTQAGSYAISDASKCDYVSGYMQLAGQKVELVPMNASTVKYARVEVSRVDRNGAVNVDNEVHPITMAAWNFGKKYLNKHVFTNQPNGDTEDLQAIVADLLSPQVLNNLKELLTGANATLEARGIGRCFVKQKSWIRLKEPTGRKLGGGCRVKEVRINDAWTAMHTSPSGIQTMDYGQRYSYVGTDATTSGVATYEPIGNKENPFVQPEYSTERHLLAPSAENFVEKPFGESFFPTPQVTYARVEVANVSGGTAPANKVVKKLHRTGSVVTEFYTSRDYPTVVDQTILEAKEDKRELLDNLLKISTKKHFTASQGYVIHLNDMNGKQKSQRVYASDQEGFISGVDYLYDNYSTPQSYNATQDPERNKGRLNNLVKVIDPNGNISMKVIGVEEDIVNDFMSNETHSRTFGVNTNLATFFVGLIPGVAPVPLPDFSKAEDQFRAVSTTKVINTFGILKETIAYDAGTSVSTRNLAWDAVTGEVLMTETIDEFSDKYYTFNYPAHWFYKGMGQAAENLGLSGTLAASSGTYSMQNIGSSLSSDFLINGDEVLYGTNLRGWVNNLSGNTFQLIDAAGNTLTTIPTATKFKVMRSGHRNLQSAGIMNVTVMKNPLLDGSGNALPNLTTTFMQATTWSDWKIINASAVDYSDDWPTGCECGLKSGGIQNPYLTNAKGVWRTRSSQAYLTTRYNQATMTPRNDGFFVKFDPMYSLTGAGSWSKNTTGWIAASEISKYSPYGFEVENVDALDRYSAAQYGYNNTLPMAVGANTRYREIGFDGFEDYGFGGCPSSPHFRFNAPIETTANTNNAVLVSDKKSHTGKYSLQVNGGQRSTITKKLNCPTGL